MKSVFKNYILDYSGYLCLIFTFFNDLKHLIMTNMENIKKPERGPVPFHIIHDKNTTIKLGEDAHQCEKIEHCVLHRQCWVTVVVRCHQNKSLPGFVIVLVMMSLCFYLLSSLKFTHLFWCSLWYISVQNLDLHLLLFL